jgi:hypothetical protein
MIRLQKPTSSNPAKAIKKKNKISKITFGGRIVYKNILPPKVILLILLFILWRDGLTGVWKCSTVSYLGECGSFWLESCSIVKIKKAKEDFRTPNALWTNF